MFNLRVQTKLLIQILNALVHSLSNLGPGLFPFERAPRGPHLHGFLLDFLERVCSGLDPQSPLTFGVCPVNGPRRTVSNGRLSSLFEEVIYDLLLSLDLNVHMIILLLEPVQSPVGSIFGVLARSTAALACLAVPLAAALADLDDVDLCLDL